MFCFVCLFICFVLLGVPVRKHQNSKSVGKKANIKCYRKYKYRRKQKVSSRSLDDQGGLLAEFFFVVLTIVVEKAPIRPFFCGFN